MANKEYERFAELYDADISVWETWIQLAKQDLEFYLGKQYTTKDLNFLRDKRRTALIFNKIRKIIKIITGYQRKNRLSIKVDPVEGSDVETASIFSEVIQFIMQSVDGYNIVSESFEQGSLKTGINLLSLWIDYNEDPLNGDIKVSRVPYNKFLLDGNFSKRDLSDCQHILSREMLTKDAVTALFPNRKKDVKDMSPVGRDNKFTHIENAHNIRNDKLLRYDMIWERVYNPVKVLVNGKTGQFTRWRGDNRSLNELMQQMPQLISIDKMEKDINLKIFVEEELFYNGKELNGLTDLPFVPVIGFFDSEHDNMEDKLQGIVRCMRDPQIEANKRRSKMLDILDSQINSGWLAEENSLVDPASIYATGQGSSLWYKTGKTPPQKIPPADVPAGQFQFTELMDKDIVDIAGANSELLGMPDKPDVEVSGILSKLRQGAGLTILQDLFDNLSLSEKGLAQKMISTIQNNYDSDKIKRITNREPTPEFYNKDFGKYDAVPVEGVLTDTQRQMNYLQLFALKKEGAPIPWEAIIEAAPIERKDLLAKIVSDAQKQAQESQKIEIAGQMSAIENEKAKTAKEQASTQEKLSKILVNESLAGLNKVKAVTELASVKKQSLTKR